MFILVHNIYLSLSKDESPHRKNENQLKSIKRLVSANIYLLIGFHGIIFILIQDTQLKIKMMAPNDCDEW